MAVTIAETVSPPTLFKRRGVAPGIAVPAPGIESAEAARRSDAGAGCNVDDNAGYGNCSRAEVIVADRDLRQAYLRAIDVGVDRGQLVSIRNRWARLRASDYDRPEDLLADYAELTDRLDRAADDAGSDLR